MEKSMCLLFAVSIAAMLLSCEDTIKDGRNIDESVYESISGNTVYLRDKESFETEATTEFYGDAELCTVSVKAGLNKASATDVSGTVSIDEGYLAAYNTTHKTNYELLPAEQVTIASNGQFTIAAGSKYSPDVKVDITASATVQAAGKTYVLPLTITVNETEAKTIESDCHVIYLVRDMRSLSVADKGNAAKSIVMYDGGINPMNALAFELENGKLLWDLVVLFSSNIIWDSDNGRPCLFHNKEIKWAFDNRDKVLVPLQKRGMKIILSILPGNNGIAGVAQLSAMGAKDFAAEVARFVYANDVDGVFLDDEYAAAPDLSNPYLAIKGYLACARLYHELKKLMPDKLMISYEYSNTGTNGMQNAYFPVTGIDVSEYIDIVCADYNGTGGQYGLITIDRCTGLSIELNPNINRGGNFTTAVGNTIKNSGYGYWMAFNPNPAYYLDSSGSGYSNRGVFNVRFQNGAGGIEVLYGSKLKQPTVFYKKMDTTPYAWPSTNGY